MRCSRTHPATASCVCRSVWVLASWRGLLSRRHSRGLLCRRHRGRGRLGLLCGLLLISHVCVCVYVRAQPGPPLQAPQPGSPLQVPQGPQASRPPLRAAELLDRMTEICGASSSPAKCSDSYTRCFTPSSKPARPCTNKLSRS